jgi:hypothetical protein
MVAKRQPTTENLLQLTFVSRAPLPLGEIDLAAIRASSQRHNARLGLTGLMIYREGRFFATLEGPERALLRRMEVIITDPRHVDLRILNERRITARRFENWSLAVLPSSAGGVLRSRADDALIAMLAGRLP